MKKSPDAAAHERRGCPAPLASTAPRPHSRVPQLALLGCLAVVLMNVLLSTGWTARRIGSAPRSEFHVPAVTAAANDFAVIDHATPSDRAKMKAFAGGRVGYIVWESRRPSGTSELKYRIWKRNLDGTGLAMISGAPGEAGYAHMGPRISPDGRRVIFAGRRWNSESREPGVQVLYGGAYAAPPHDAWVVDIDPVTFEAGTPRELRCLRGQVGSAGQARFFAWKDARTVYVNIPSHGGIFEVDVVDDRIGRKVVSGVRGEVLLSASGQYLFCAAGGNASFGPIQPGVPTATVGTLRHLGGCEVALSSLNDFLVWTRSAGHIGVLDLRGHRTPQEDDRPGRDLGLNARIQAAYPPYEHCYFPALSRDRTLLVCGASRLPPGVDPSRFWLRQSHRGADYEIFAFHFDPETLTAIGPPVRFSYNTHAMHPEYLKHVSPEEIEAAFLKGQALDRWPDVWVRNERFERDHAQRTESSRDKAEALLAQAAKLETINPPRALRLYRRLLRSRSDVAAARARDRIAALNRNPEFRKEVEAWSVLERMRAAASNLRPPRQGARSFASNPLFARANRAVLNALRAGYATLRERFPDTRAVIEARALLRRWEVPMPGEVPDRNRVLAVADLVVSRISPALTCRDVEPYRQAFLVAECMVSRVVSGALPERRVVVVLMSLNGGQSLPPASYRPGDRFRARLGRWSAQTHFESHPVSDEIVDLDATYYYAFSVEPTR